MRRVARESTVSKKTGNYKPYGGMRIRAEYMKQKAIEHCRKYGHDFTDDGRCRRCGEPKGE